MAVTNWAENIVAGTTLLDNSHILEMRTALTNERNRRDYTTKPNALTGSDPGDDGTSFFTTDIQDLRNYIAGNYGSFSPSDNPLSKLVTPIKEIHITELRAKINALESNPAKGGSKDCNGTCTGLCNGACTNCTGCSGGCSGGCHGCSGCDGCDWAT